MQEGGKWALLIGVDNYDKSLGSLKYSSADCRAIKDALIAGPLAFPEDQIIILSDDQGDECRPTYGNIHARIATWLANLNEEDIVLVYFAGHGRLMNGQTYLAPCDATSSTLHNVGIPLSHIQDLMRDCKSERKLLIMDACHSGAGRDINLMDKAMLEALAQGTGFYTISSCSAEEQSYEWDEAKQGVFSYYLCEAFKGAIPFSDEGFITVDNIYYWVHNQVIGWARKLGFSQKPRRFVSGAGEIILAESGNEATHIIERQRKEIDRDKRVIERLKISLGEVNNQLSEQIDAKAKEVSRARLSKKLIFIWGIITICLLGTILWQFGNRAYYDTLEMKAKRQAQDMLTKAQQEVQSKLSYAEIEVSRLVADANASAKSIIGDAESKADALINSANDRILRIEKDSKSRLEAANAEVAKAVQLEQEAQLRIKQAEVKITNASQLEANAKERITQAELAISNATKDESVAKNEISQLENRIATLNSEEMNINERIQNAKFNENNRIVRAYIADKLPSKQSALYGVNSAGEEKVILNLTEMGIYNASSVDVSPDCKRVIFLGKAFGEVKNTLLFVVFTNGEGLVNLSNYNFYADQNRIKYYDKLLWLSNNSIAVLGSYNNYSEYNLEITIDDNNRILSATSR